MPKNLFVPRKNDKNAHPGYQQDMRDVEIWARQPIQQLIAGSGVTLSPTNGLATDAKGNGPNAVTISASSGVIYHLACFIDVVSPVPTAIAQEIFQGLDLTATDNNTIELVFGPVQGFGPGPTYTVLQDVGYEFFPTIPVGGTLTLESSAISVMDATCANQLVLGAGPSPQFVGPGGNPIIGWTVSSSVGAQLALGAPQISNLVTTTSATNTYWINVNLSMSSSGLH